MKTVSINPDDLQPAFDLFESIEESQNAYDKQDKDLIKSLSLYAVPTYAGANLDRVIFGEKVSHEEARWCCIQYGIRRLFASDEFGEWKKLYELATSKDTTYDNDGDWDDVHERLRRFSFKPRDCHSGTYSTNARMPEPIRAQVSGAAKVLGMSASMVATIGFIDALREIDGVMHKKDMDETMEEFYALLERRTRRLRHLLVEIEVMKPGQVL